MKREGGGVLHVVFVAGGGVGTVYQLAHSQLEVDCNVTSVTFAQ
jgi:hypothetical protein